MASVAPVTVTKGENMVPWCSHKAEYLCSHCMKCAKCCECKSPYPELIHRVSKRAADRERELVRLQSE